MTYQPTKKSTPRLVRSNTRITVLEWCERKYYLNYYTFALKDSHPEIRLQAHILKGLKSLQMRIGEKTHYLLSDYLHYLKEAVLIGQPITATGITTFKEQMRTEMETEFTLSKERDYTDSTDFYKRF
ncbi:MAG: hypothetical protein LBU27_00020 [Candidatus Peribacteria bacterium]|jgi:hypothetical protein|nr:hypothetical protein [Candidatus Peribacteria bacterium]